MTTPTLDAIAAEIETLRDHLRTVNAAVSLLGKSAVAKATELEADIRHAEECYAAALADKAEQDRKDRIAGFTDISISTSYPDQNDGNLLRASFVISYTRLEWDGRYRQSLPVNHSCNGFSALPDDAYIYLVTERPEAIPPEIMTLHPGNPHEAFRAYFQGRQRGVFRTASRVDAASDLSIAA